jgi:plasmid stabilization system protein ParE
LDFINERSPEGAQRWWDAFRAAATRAISHPEQCPFAPENSLVDQELRQFFFKTRRGKKYRAIFMIAGDELLILRVRAPAQGPLAGDELLDEGELLDN